MEYDNLTVSERKLKDLALLERLHSICIYTTEDFERWCKMHIEHKPELLPIWDELP